MARAVNRAWQIQRGFDVAKKIKARQEKQKQECDNNNKNQQKQQEATDQFVWFADKEWNDLRLTKITHSPYRMCKNVLL